MHKDKAFNKGLIIVYVTIVLGMFILSVGEDVSVTGYFVKFEKEKTEQPEAAKVKAKETDLTYADLSKMKFKGYEVIDGTAYLVDENDNIYLLNDRIFDETSFLEDTENDGLRQLDPGYIQRFAGASLDTSLTKGGTFVNSYADGSFTMETDDKEIYVTHGVMLTRDDGYFSKGYVLADGTTSSPTGTYIKGLPEGEYNLNPYTGELTREDGEVRMVLLSGGERAIIKETTGGKIIYEVYAKGATESPKKTMEFESSRGGGQFFYDEDTKKYYKLEGGKLVDVSDDLGKVEWTMMYLEDFFSYSTQLLSGYSGVHMFYDEPDPIVELDETMSNLLGGIEGWSSILCQSKISDTSNMGAAFGSRFQDGAWAFIQGEKTTIINYNTTTPTTEYLYKIGFKVEPGNEKYGCDVTFTTWMDSTPLFSNGPGGSAVKFVANKDGEAIDKTGDKTIFARSSASYSKACIKFENIEPVFIRNSDGTKMRCFEGVDEGDEICYDLRTGGTDDGADNPYTSGTSSESSSSSTSSSSTSSSSAGEGVWI